MSDLKVFHPLRIDHFFGSTEVTSDAELLDVMGMRCEANNANKFDISSMDCNYPFLSVMVNDDLAVLHYFSEDGGDCWISNNLNPCVSEDVIFWESENSDGIPLPCDSVVEYSVALNAVKNFAANLSKPQLIDWMEL